MKQHVFIASDHGGYVAKGHLIKDLMDEYAVVDLGPAKLDPDDDYPPYAEHVAREVVTHRDSRGILLCRSGQGMEIAANKVAGARAAIAWNEKIARESRADNDSNILSLPADQLSTTQLIKIARAWLKTDFSQADRHIRRIKEISAIEEHS